LLVVNLTVFCVLTTKEIWSTPPRTVLIGVLVRGTNDGVTPLTSVSSVPSPIRKCGCPLAATS
jgi:hypothetical protein